MGCGAAPCWALGLRSGTGGGSGGGVVVLEVFEGGNG